MTLTELLNDLISSHEITGAFDSEGVLQDMYLSFYAERKITCWYMQQGELIGEATAGYEVQLSNTWERGSACFGGKFALLLKKQAMEWLKNSDAWKNAESELQKRFDTPPERSFKEDVFRALDPTR